MTDRLKVVPHPEAINLLTSQADQLFLRAILLVSQNLAVSYREQHAAAGDTRLLTIPRGGLLVGKAVETVVHPQSHVLVNDGMNRIPTAPLIPPNLDPTARVIVADGIVGSGRSAKNTIRAISEQSQAKGVRPEIAFMAPVISALSAYSEDNLIDWARQEGIDLHVYTSHVEEETKTVTFNLPDGSKKTVLIVGKVYRAPDGSFSGCQIGDYGDMTMELLGRDWYEPLVSSVLGLALQR